MVLLALFCLFTGCVVLCWFPCVALLCALLVFFVVIVLRCVLFCDVVCRCIVFGCCVAFGCVLFVALRCCVVLISFPDLAGGRSRRRDLVKSDLYHVIACQECGRQVNSACPRQF